MYVLSQEGDIAINVKSIVGFKVEQNQFSKEWEMRTIFPDSEYRIAIYNTEKRAKEVLQDIIEHYHEIEKKKVIGIAGQYYYNIPKE